MPNITLNTDNSRFEVAQVGDIFYATNLWNFNVANYTDSGNIQWTIPAGTGSNGCFELPVEGSADDTGSCTMCWRINDGILHNDGQGQDPLGSTNHVHAFPFMLFGSLGGGRETWGRICGTTQSLSGNSLERCNNSRVYDMNTPNANIGLPSKIDDIGTLSFCFDVIADCTGADGNIENVFIDTYLHRIDNSNLWPTNFQTGWGDLNKINENATETWNINFKLCLPEGLNANQATGGPSINSTPITIDGRDWEIHVKREGSGPRDLVTGLVNNDVNNKCNNSFYYISFVPWGADGNVGGWRGYCDVTNFCIDYTAFLDYVKSQEFKDRVLAQNGFPQVPYQGQTHFPSWIYDQVGRPPFPVDSPDDYVLDGIMIGNELWHSPTNTESCVCWSNVSFTSDRGTFGKTQDPIIIEPPDPEPEPEPEECFEPEDGCKVYIEGSGKQNFEEICFGFDEEIINFGRAAEKGLVPQNHLKAKNSKCGVTTKSCLAPHETCLVWCNLCLHDNAKVSAFGTRNGSPENVCECEDGAYWSFSSAQNPTTGTIIPADFNLEVENDDGTGCYADTIIIWDHDLCNDYTNVIELYVDGAFIDRFVVDPECKHCCSGNRCSPIYFYLKEGVIGKEWNLTFRTKKGFIHCIGNISFGVSFPIDLYAGFENFFYASRYKRKESKNSCGWMPSSLIENIQETEVTLTDLEETSFVDCILDFIDYADVYPFYFVFSKNNLPQNIARVRLTEEGIPAPVYDDELCQSLTLPLEVRLHPTKLNEFSDSFSCRTENGQVPLFPANSGEILRLDFTELTGVNESDTCQIIDGSARLITNEALGSITSSNNEVVIRADTAAGVQTIFSYDVRCGNNTYTCQLGVIT